MKKYIIFWEDKSVLNSLKDIIDIRHPTIRAGISAKMTIRVFWLDIKGGMIFFCFFLKSIFLISDNTNEALVLSISHVGPTPEQGKDSIVLVRQ